MGPQLMWNMHGEHEEITIIISLMCPVHSLTPGIIIRNSDYYHNTYLDPKL